MATDFQTERQFAPQKCPEGLLVETEPHSRLHNGLRAECLYCKATWQLRLLLLLAPDRAVTLQHFAAVDELIAALPLTNGELAGAQDRIIDAARYYREGKLDAATFELRLLGHSLQSRPAEHRSRRRRRPCLAPA